MDRTVLARNALSEIVRRVGKYLDGSKKTEIETSVITDTEHDQYGLRRQGWRVNPCDRVSNTVFFARIKDGKIWIEEDNSDLGLADELLKAGIAKEDIVLAFQPPEMRRYSEFAVT